MTYPSWSYFPRNARPPQWALDVVEVTQLVEAKIHTRDAGKEKDETSSDAVLAQLAPGLQALGFAVEKGKSADSKIRRPVLFGDDGRVELAYEIDAFHDTLGVAVEVEAGRGAMNGADFRDIVRTSLLLDATYLAMWLPNIYHYKVKGRPMTKMAFESTRGTLEAIYASRRLKLPFEGILVVGY